MGNLPKTAKTGNIFPNQLMDNFIVLKLGWVVVITFWLLQEIVWLPCSIKSVIAV